MAVCTTKTGGRQSVFAEAKLLSYNRNAGKRRSYYLLNGRIINRVPETREMRTQLCQKVKLRKKLQTVRCALFAAETIINFHPKSEKNKKQKLIIIEQVLIFGKILETPELNSNTALLYG